MAAGAAAASASAAWFIEHGHGEMPFRGILPATLTTPGAVASWVEAHREYGRLPLQRDLESAIGYAREGFPVTERLAGWITATAQSWRRMPNRPRSSCRRAALRAPAAR